MCCRTVKFYLTLQLCMYNVYWITLLVRGFHHRACWSDYIILFAPKTKTCGISMQKEYTVLPTSYIYETEINWKCMFLIILGSYYCCANGSTIYNYYEPVLRFYVSEKWMTVDPQNFATKLIPYRYKDVIPCRKTSLMYIHTITIFEPSSKSFIQVSN